jgi:hypothetical protein
MFEHLVSRRFEWYAQSKKHADDAAVRASVLGDFEPYFREVGSHSLPHAGCGFGMNRIAQGLIGKSTIEEIDAFPVTYAGFRKPLEMVAATNGHHAVSSEAKALDMLEVVTN